MGKDAAGMLENTQTEMCQLTARIRALQPAAVAAPVAAAAAPSGFEMEALPTVRPRAIVMVYSGVYCTRPCFTQTCNTHTRTRITHTRTRITHTRARITHTGELHVAGQRLTQRGVPQRGMRRRDARGAARVRVRGPSTHPAVVLEPLSFCGTPLCSCMETPSEISLEMREGSSRIKTRPC